MKRVRVRLRANTVDELCRQFGHRLRADGVLLPLRWALPTGEDLQIAVFYGDQRLALAGRGRVDPRRSGRSADADYFVRVDWSPRCADLLRAALQTGAPSGSETASIQSHDLASAQRPSVPPVDATADVLHAGRERRLGRSAPTRERDPGEVTPLARIELVRRTEEDVGPTTADLLAAGGAGPLLDGGHPELGPKGRCVLGIDLGSRSTRVAARMSDVIRPVPTRRGSDALPSVIHADPAGKTFVGEVAVRRAHTDPVYGVRDFRRMMGRAFEAPGVRDLAQRSLYSVVPGAQGETAVALGPHIVPLEEVAAVLFKEVREASSLVLSDRANRAVLTVPGWAGPQLRDSVRLAAELGGLHVERLVGEAAAVALDFATDHPRRRGTALVVSLGSGLLDLALVEVDGGTVRTVSNGGTFDVGGDDFDRALAPLFVEAVEDATGERPAESPSFFAALASSSRRVKEALSSQDRAVGVLEQPLPDGQAFRIEVELTRGTAEARWRPIVDRALREIESLLERSEFDHVDFVIAAGQQMKTRLLRERIGALLPSSQWEEAADDAAARGAAILGDRAAMGQPPGLVERASRSLALASRDVELRVLFRAGAAMPASRELAVDLRPDGELILVQSVGPVSANAWVAIGRLDIAAGPNYVHLRVGLSSDGQLGIVGEVPGADWRPIGLEPLTEAERRDPWWDRLPVRGDAPLEPDLSSGGFVGWLRRRLRPS